MPTPDQRENAAWTGCAILAMAIAVGLTTDWKVRRIAADQVADAVAQHSNARFEVFESYDRSRAVAIT